MRSEQVWEDGRSAIWDLHTIQLWIRSQPSSSSVSGRSRCAYMVAFLWVWTVPYWDIRLPHLHEYWIKWSDWLMPCWTWMTDRSALIIMNHFSLPNSDTQGLCWPWNVKYLPSMQHKSWTPVNIEKSSLQFEMQEYSRELGAMLHSQSLRSQTCTLTQGPRNDFWKVDSYWALYHPFTFSSMHFHLAAKVPNHRRSVSARRPGTDWRRFSLMIKMLRYQLGTSSRNVWVDRM